MDGQAEWNLLKDQQTINANANAIDAEVASAMIDIDAEYEALCNEFALATV